MIALSPPITLDLRAMPLTEALPIVGKAFGARMRAAPAIGSEIVIASLKGVDLPGFRAKLAALFAGEWSVDADGTLVFNRSTKLRAAEAEANAARRLEEVRTWRTHYAELIADAPTFGTQEAQGLRRELDSFLKIPTPKEFSIAHERSRERLSGRTPSRRAYVAALLAMPDAALIATDLNSRTVYSSRPTAMQRPLPFDGAALARRYAREETAWADATADLPPPTPNSRWTQIDRRAAPVLAPPPLVTVAVSSSFGLANVELTMYDAAGRRVMRESGFAGDQQWTNDAERAKAREETKFDVPLAPETLGFLRAFYPTDDGPGGTPEDVAKAKPFFDVRARDPLSYAASDVLFALAAKRGTSLLARGGDEMMGIGYGLDPERGEIGSMSGVRMEDIGLRSDDADGWTLVASKDPGHAAATFLPRERLARMLALAQATGLGEIEDRAEVARLYPDLFEFFDGARIVERPYGLNPYDHVALALYGEIPANLRAAAREPDGVPVGTLPPPAKELMRRLFFDVEGRLTFSPEVANPEVEARRAAMEATTGGEVTFALPSGVPVGARLSLHDETLAAVRLGDGQFANVFTPAELAEAVWRERHLERFPGRRDDPLELDALFSLRQRRLRLEVRLTPDLVYARTMTTEVRDGGPPVKLDALPASFAAAYRAAYDAEEARWRGVPLPPSEPKEGAVPPPQ